MSFELKPSPRRFSPEKPQSGPDEPVWVEVESTPSSVEPVAARKVSSPELSRLAAQVLRDPQASQREKRLAASVLSQDETAGD